jgi:hypothetical protein
MSFRASSQILLAALMLMSFSKLCLAENPQQSKSTSGVLLKLDVSGMKGADGKHGKSYSGPSQPASDGSGFIMNSITQDFLYDAVGVGADVLGLLGGGGSDGNSGQTGGNAGPASPGQNAGSLKVRVSRSGESLKGVLILDADLLYPSGDKKKENQIISYGNSGSIYLYSQGGRGGAGGWGGGGGPGKPGEPGRPATRHIPGGNGGDGGDGGDGGHATSGEKAGDGGVIQVEVDEKDMGLLLLVEPFVDGGNGGEKGVNGPGGDGGRRGPGGPSAMGSETKYRTAYRSVSDGNGGTTQESYEESYEDPWFMIGGSDGREGRRGQDGYASVQDGKNGQTGKVEYVVAKSDGTKVSASAIFNLTLEKFEFTEHDDNGIIEPGETITVNHLTVKNSGGLPTPPSQTTEVFLANSNWILSSGERLPLPKSLQPGESYTFEKPLHFVVKRTEIFTNGPRLMTDDTIRPISVLNDVNRQHPNFRLEKQFQITFPLEISQISGTRSLAPGESTQLVFKVRNISKSDLGMMSEIKRRILHSIRSEGGNIDISHMTLTNDRGQIIPLSEVGHSQGIDFLQPGLDNTVKVNLKISENAQPFTQQNIQVGLHLQDPDPANHEKISRIQNQGIKLSVAQAFRPSKETGLLLITNANTNMSEVQAWKSLSEKMSVSLDIWDASYYKGLPLLEKKDGQSLVDLYKGKTIIILDNEWSAFQGEQERGLRSLDLLKKKDFIQAAAANGINIYVVGSQTTADTILDKYYYPSDSLNKKQMPFSEFLKGLND